MKTIKRLIGSVYIVTFFFIAPATFAKNNTLDQILQCPSDSCVTDLLLSRLYGDSYSLNEKVWRKIHFLNGQLISFSQQISFEQYKMHILGKEFPAGCDYLRAPENQMICKYGHSAYE